MCIKNSHLQSTTACVLAAGYLHGSFRKSVERRRRAAAAAGGARSAGLPLTGQGAGHGTVHTGGRERRGCRAAGWRVWLPRFCCCRRRECWVMPPLLELEHKQLVIHSNSQHLQPRSAGKSATCNCRPSWAFSYFSDAWNLVCGMQGAHSHNHGSNKLQSYFAADRPPAAATALSRPLVVECWRPLAPAHCSPRWP